MSAEAAQRFALRPSGTQRRWQSAQALTLSAAYLWLALWQPLAVAVAPLVIVWMVWRLRSASQATAQAIEHAEAGWYLWLADGRRVPVYLAGRVWLTPALAILPLRSRVNHVRLTLRIWPDSLEDAARRRLYRLLAAAGEPPGRVDA